MADDDSPGDRVAKEWPLEGHFVVGGSGLYVHTDCLGRTFASRTANYDLTIGLPQLPQPHQLPQSPRRLATMGPPRALVVLLPPAWTCGPGDQQELAVNWGAASRPGAKNVYPEAAKDAAIVYRCRFYTTLTASNVEEFDAVVDSFLSELDDWWTRFTSWVGVLTVQDFVGLGGYARRGATSGSLSTWTSDEHGQRTRVGIRSYLLPRLGIPSRTLLLRHMQACVTAACNQDLAPAEWLFIRDARSLLNAGDFRRAVIDACMAAELSVTALIDRKFDQLGTSQTDREQQLGNHHGLQRLIKLNNRLRASTLPSRLQQDVAEPRNRAVHQGVTSSYAEARAAILKATEVVELAYPLAYLVPV